jgi:hypothetical protein
MTSNAASNRFSTRPFRTGSKSFTTWGNPLRFRPTRGSVTTRVSATVPPQTFKPASTLPGAKWFIPCPTTTGFHLMH